MERQHMPKDGSTLAESIKIEAAFRVENELKLIGRGVKLITVKRRVGSGGAFANGSCAATFYLSPQARGEGERRNQSGRTISNMASGLISK
jgi:hypothetical protein